MIRSGNYNEIHISGKTPHDLLVGNWKYQAYQSGWFRRSLGQSVLDSFKLKPLLSLYNMGICCSNDCSLVGRTVIRLAYRLAFPAQYRNC